MHCAHGYDLTNHIEYLYDDKFNNIASHYYQLLRTAESLPDNVRVYIINHLDENQNGEEIIKVVGGKMITEKIDCNFKLKKHSPSMW